MCLFFDNFFIASIYYSFRLKHFYCVFSIWFRQTNQPIKFISIFCFGDDIDDTHSRKYIDITRLFWFMIFHMNKRTIFTIHSIFSPSLFRIGKNWQFKSKNVCKKKKPTLDDTGQLRYFRSQIYPCRYRHVIWMDDQLKDGSSLFNSMQEHSHCHLAILKYNFCHQ